MSPEFSEKTKKAIADIVARYPEKEAALLPVLHAACLLYTSDAADDN